MVSGSDHGQYAQTGQQGNLQPKVMVIIIIIIKSFEIFCSECSSFEFNFLEDFLLTNSFRILMLTDLSEKKTKKIFNK